MIILVVTVTGQGDNPSYGSLFLFEKQNSWKTKQDATLALVQG